ncbi:LysR family transcriptional regulator [Thioclava sp. A2]|uniref:LysR family transcriptional regulator n=1 Tax=Thioclava sp. FCG-A2 TaxID=3080562 RepID=UPI002952DD77|nr:LysR family transcriptional regulator [Thioclava sp. A2]MDV7271387.1 LysR family transcriptional regulator [Thioclava sp. A2]
MTKFAHMLSVFARGAMSGFDWEDLRYFLETERAGRLSRAARRLKVSHTTVARRIERLEASLKTRLFDRGDDGMVLTAAGAEILRHAVAMEAASQAIEDHSGASLEALSGTVRVGAPDGFGNAFLSRMLPHLLAREPELTVELVPVPVNHKLWKRDVDIAISLERPETGRLVMRKLLDYDLRIYGAPALFEEREVPTTRAALSAFPFVGYIDDLIFTQELDFNYQIDPDLRVSYKAATVKAQFDAVRAGAGLGVLPCFMANNAGLVPVMADDIPFTRSYWLLFPEDYRNVARIRYVCDFIAAETLAHQAEFTFRP